MPSPTNDDPETPNQQSLADRMAKLSPAQRELLKKRLADRGRPQPDDAPTSPTGSASPDSTASRDESKSGSDRVAVVGTGCRFGDAKSPDEFWELICQRREVSARVPEGRWDRERYFDRSGRTPGKMAVDTICAVPDVDQFDPAFFGITPREAARMDPQQRLLLEVTWEAFENAGIPIDTLAGSKTGVFIGVGTTDYSKVPARYPNYFEHVDAHTGTGNALSIAAGRISYLFDFRGPTMVLDTACSSSLVAMHSAVVSLERGECDFAVVGGVNAIVSPETSIAFSKAKMLSPDGRCRPFDRDANGYVRGEGCGVVLLQRTADATRQKNNIQAIVLGSAVNQDGRTSGITAPNSQSQVAVVRQAIDAAGISVDDIGYVEAHGTGTPLGDPIEMMALGEVFSSRTANHDPIRVGSVKANVGHTETASGIAGFIKLVEMLRHQTIPAQPNFATLNPNIRIPAGVIEVARTSQDWKPNGRDLRIAGISSFGFSGTNAHVIVQQPIATTAETEGHESDQNLYSLPLSARDSTAIKKLAAAYADTVSGRDQRALADLCAAATSHRAGLPFRAVAIGKTSDEIAHSLRRFAADSETDVIDGQKSTSRRPRIAMMFTGQGSQAISMASQLASDVPEFREALGKCETLINNWIDEPLSEIIAGKSVRNLDHTSYAQPAICAIECAMVDALRAHGVKPNVVVGHSIGEIAGLYAIGVLDRKEALRIATIRGRLMGQLTSVEDSKAAGAMAAILTTDDVVSRWIEATGSSVVIAAMNGHGNTVIAGTCDEVEAMIEHANDQNVATRRLAVSHAFHSPLMLDAAEPLREELSAFLKPKTIPGTATFISTLTGVRETKIDVDYWIKHLLSPVRFSDAIETLAELDVDLAIEVGPKSQLCGMVRRTLAASTSQRTTNELKTTAVIDGKRPDLLCWSQTLAEAWSVGAKAKLNSREVPRGACSLPNYPFQHQRCWYEPPKAGNHEAGGAVVHPLLGVRQQLASGHTLFRNALRSEEPYYLSDHVVSGAVTVPAAAWIEAIRAAAADVFEEASFEICDLDIERALFLEQGQPVEVQIDVSPIRGGRSRIQISALTDVESAEWQSCATAVAVRASHLASTHRSLCEPADNVSAVDVDSLYEAMSAVGLEYGPDFQVITAIESDGRHAIAKLQLSPNLDNAASQLHPTLIDGALQTIAAVVPDTLKSTTYLPSTIGKIRLGELAPIAKAIVHCTQASANLITADIDLLAVNDECVASLSSVQLKALSKSNSTTVANPENWIYHTRWEPSLDVESADESELGFQIESSHPIVFLGNEELESIVAPPFDASETREHWVWTWTAHEDDESQATTKATSQLLATVKSALNANRAPMLSIVTKQAHSIGIGEPSDPVATALDAMARVVANEHPQLEVRCLDVDSIDEDSASAIANWLGRSGNESQLALRRSRFFAPRLIADESDASLSVPSHGSYRVRLDGTDRMEGLWTERIALPKPASGELLLEVSAIGLNFSDVLKAMGLYPGIEDEVVPMGIEICGRVTSVGENVDSSLVGKRVMGVVPYGFASHAVTKDYLVVPVPESLSDQEAASIPIVFLTAHHALRKIARLQSGEKVLIHAGAGGVGLAAIQIAHSIGAEVFTTAGSPAKRRLLQQMGVPAENIYSSRDLDSIQQIRQRTGGTGVDVVLNSMPGEWIDASLGLLAAHGRFLEIGKTDIYQNRAIGLLPFQDNLSYSAIDLDRMFRFREAEVRELFREVTELFQDGTYQSTPLTSFRLSELAEAMRFMAGRRNIGKIVLTPTTPEPERVAREGAYLITGGSGSIALGLAKRLIQRGATAVALVARRPVNDAVQSLQDWAKTQNGSIAYLQADCSDEASMNEAVDQAVSQFGKVVGVVHAAGLLDDRMVHDLDADSLQRVLAPKVDGVIALEKVTKHQPISSFTVLGSVASVFGSPGQANYAAANAFLQGFVKRRRAKGKPASIVHWGPWGSNASVDIGGMADDPARLKNLASRGLTPLKFDAALDLLIDGAVENRESFVAVDAKFGVMLGGTKETSIPSILRSQKSDADSAVGGSTSIDTPFLSEIKRLESDQRRQRITDYFIGQLASIMSTGAEAIDPQAPLAALGLDSLMAFELKNTIEAKLDISIPINRFVDNPSIVSLAETTDELIVPSEASVTSEA